MSKFSGNLNYGSNLPAKVGNTEVKKNNIIDSYFHEDDVLKLANFSVGDFSDKLEKSIGANKRMFIWSKRRENEKIRLDNEYQVLLFEKIQNLRINNREVNLLKADALFSEECILNYIAGKRMEAEQIFEQAVATHNLILTKTKSEIDLANAKIKHDEIERDGKRIQNANVDADTKIKLAQAEKILSEARVVNKKIDVIEKLLSDADFNHLTPHQAYLLQSFLDADPSKFSEFQIREELKDIIKQEKQAEADKKQAEAEGSQADTDLKRFKNEQIKKDAKL